MKPVYVCKNPHEKNMQRALIQYRNPKNYDLVMEALKLAHREDLIGFDKKCLIRPRKLSSDNNNRSQNVNNTKGTGKNITKKKTIRNTHKRK
jgi:hypothetical protein